MSLLIVFRHGNTFAPGQQVICAGQQDGLPLVAEGRAQARRAGLALAAARPWQRPDRALPLGIASPRLRAQQFLTGLLKAWQATPAPPQLAQSAWLDEIDYGSWTGQTRAALRARGLSAQVASWDTHGRWPEGVDWQPQAGQLVAELEAFLAGITAPLQVAVSHAGRMRYLLACLDRPMAHFVAQGLWKVGCGHAVVLRRVAAVHGPSRWRLVGWDLSPDALPAFLA